MLHAFIPIFKKLIKTSYFTCNVFSNSFPHQSIRAYVSIIIHAATEQLGVFALPPGWDASSLQGYSQALNSLVPPEPASRLK